MEEGGAPGWRGKREGGGRGSRRREAGRADAAGEGAGQEGEGERERRKAEAAAAAAVAAAATAAAAALQVAPRSGFRRRAGERASSSGQTPGRTIPATRAPWRHCVHPGAAQAPRAGKEARTRGARNPGGLRYSTAPRPAPQTRPSLSALQPGGGGWVEVQGMIKRRRAWGPSTRAPSHFWDLG